MAIKNISDQKVLPRVGKIHLGVKDKEKGYPKMVSHFVVKEDMNTPKEAVDAFKNVYGEKPKRLDIIIPCEDEETFFPQYLKAYNSKKQLICKGDGEKSQKLHEDGKYKEVPCKGKECEVYKAKKCREVANLKFMLPKVPGIGVWQIDTSSINSIIALNSAIQFIRQQSKGRISGIPLVLSLQPKEIVHETMKKTVYVLNLLLESRLSDIAVDIESNEDECPDEPPAEVEEEKKSIEADEPEPDEIDDYPIGEDNTTVPIYEIVEKGKIHGRNALKIKQCGANQVLTVLSKDEVKEKKGAKIIAQIEQQGKYHVLLNYKTA